jgi:glycosyltransferase involved in cell wall biosynthesis
VPKTDELHLLYVGRFERIKGVTKLIRLQQKLERDKQRNIYLHLVGAGSLEGEMKKLAVKLNLKHVVFEGYLKGNKLAQMSIDVMFL